MSKLISVMLIMGLGVISLRWFRFCLMYNSWVNGRDIFVVYCFCWITWPALFVLLIEGLLSILSTIVWLLWQQLSHLGFWAEMVDVFIIYKQFYLLWPQAAGRYNIINMATWQQGGVIKINVLVIFMLHYKVVSIQIYWSNLELSLNFFS